MTENQKAMLAEYLDPEMYTLTDIEIDDILIDFAYQRGDLIDQDPSDYELCAQLEIRDHSVFI